MRGGARTRAALAWLVSCVGVCFVAACGADRGLPANRALDDAGSGDAGAHATIDSGPPPGNVIPLTDTGVDVVTSPDDAANDTAAIDTAHAPACPGMRTDYSCTEGDERSCPGGICIRGSCFGPEDDPLRWSACGDGRCDACEREMCGVDCASHFAPRGAKRYDGENTLTILLHGFGFNLSVAFALREYGAITGPDTLGADFLRFAPARPSGIEHRTAPNQIVGVDYYGGRAADWISSEDRAEIEENDWRTDAALRRYALIVAKFIRDRMRLSGATHAQIVCHSMGCHVTRYMLERDVESIASDSVVVRVTSLAGVINGATLARYFENPLLHSYATTFAINATDFIHMNPDYVRDHTAVWDHRLREANNPRLRGVLFHHVTGTDGRTGIFEPLLAINPSSYANDSVLFEENTFFESQAIANQFVARDGARFGPTHSALPAGHTGIQDVPGPHVVAAAATFSRKRVIVSLTSVRAVDDRERDERHRDERGVAPGDVAVESWARFDPYLADTFGVADLVVHRQTVEDRNAPVVAVRDGALERPSNVTLYSGPVFDAMTTLDLTVRFVEVDDYPRAGVREGSERDAVELAQVRAHIDLRNQTFTVEGDGFTATLDVRVYDID